MPSQSNRATELIAALGLVEHPEGGYYAETYRSALLVQPADDRSSRPALTSIYFLLPAGAVSRWHRVRSDEVWHFYEGAALDLWTATPEGNAVETRRLGPYAQGQRPTLTVPAGWWQAARSTGAYTLVGCTVGPGFEFQDFRLAVDQPEIASMLKGSGGSPAALL
jgi:predicted cupin superfamily sugar epimerase